MAKWKIVVRDDNIITAEIPGYRTKKAANESITKNFNHLNATSEKDTYKK